MFRLREEMIWNGDGFSSGKDQIGKRVNINGKKGRVVDAMDLSITVEWDLIQSLKAKVQSMLSRMARTRERTIFYHFWIGDK